MRMLWPLVSLLGFSALVFGGACSEEDDPDSPGASASGPGSGAASVGGQGAGGEGGGQGGGGGSVEPPELPFDWVGVIGTGQSLSVGAASAPMSTTQPFGNLKLVDNGPDPKYPIAPDTGAPQWEAVPLVEPIRQYVAGAGPGYDDGQYPNSVGGETPHSGMANTLSMLWQERGGEGEYVTAHSVVGWSGHCLSDIDKAGGKRGYPASLNEAMVFEELASAAGKTFGYGGIILTHGECDGGNASYGAGLFQLWQDYNSDLKAITGQQEDVVLLVSQQSTVAANNAGNSAVQVWRAGVDHPGQIVCVGPKYQYQYAGDLIHFEAPGYQRLGQKYAEVFDAVVNRKLPWKPLQPKQITRSDKTLTIELDVPNPPLVWDTHISAPHTQVNTAWASGRGFEVRDGNGAPLTIADAVIDGSSVVLTLADTPPAGAVRVAYAITQDGDGLQGGTNQGMRGQLRDSDDFVGHDAEQLEAQVTAGSAVITSTAPGGFVRRAGRDIVTGADVAADTVVVSHDSDDQLTLSSPWAGASGTVMLSFRHDMHNYCVHFAMDAE
jgi:hypothetical protein